MNAFFFCSRAIVTYLADKYGKNDSLYPKDPQKRALVLQRLFFDATTLYQRFADAYVSTFFLYMSTNIITRNLIACSLKSHFSTFFLQFFLVIFITEAN